MSEYVCFPFPFCYYLNQNIGKALLTKEKIEMIITEKTLRQTVKELDKKVYIAEHYNLIKGNSYVVAFGRLSGLGYCHECNTVFLSVCASVGSSDIVTNVKLCKLIDYAYIAEAIESIGLTIED